MANPLKENLISELAKRFGALRFVPGSQSLVRIGNDAALIYFRYSKVHARGNAFFGLRQIDLRQLAGQNAFICLLVNEGTPPVFLPYSDFEEVFHNATPASDGQYKVHLVLSNGGLELEIAREGKFNVEGFVGLDLLEKSLDPAKLKEGNNLSHSQVQTLLGSIGALKGYDVWIPTYDIPQLDWSLARQFAVPAVLLTPFIEIKSILAEIDVIWLARGSSSIEALFEVEHSTPIYSGLLRFNDVLLADPRLTRFAIVSNDDRRSVFSRQVFRPTFRRSGLSGRVISVLHIKPVIL